MGCFFARAGKKKDKYELAEPVTHSQGLDGKDAHKAAVLQIRGIYTAGSIRMKDEWRMTEYLLPNSIPANR